MTLILFGVGSLLMAIQFIGATGLTFGVLGVAFAFGLTVIALVYTIGPVSGCHINPAVTIGVMAIKGMKMKDGLIYIVMQIIGGIIGAAILYFMFTQYYVSSGNLLDADAIKTLFTGASCKFYDKVDNPTGFSLAAVFLGEVLIALVLQWVILGSLNNKDNKQIAGLAIGFVVVFAILLMGFVDGAGLNPIRAISPVIFAESWAQAQIWMWIVAPIIGGIVGSFLWAWLHKPEAAAAA
jgi:aquaporin Z